MKKLFALVLAAGIIGLYSCNSGGTSAAAKKNLEVNETIMKAYEAGDFSKMGDYIAADAIDHGGEAGDVKGLDNIVSEMKRYRQMMPDMKSVSARSLADDEYVFTWSTVSGTVDGQKMIMNSVDITKFKDGKAVEHWVYMDPKDMMKMMQNMPQPAAPAAADSLGKK